MGFTSPLGGPTVSGNLITVDEMTNPATRIPAIIRDLVAANEGYWIEEVFATPGFTVEGGAVIYDETFPEDHFLEDDGNIAPRAPGAEAPRLSVGRRAPKIARPESWSGSLEVHDEARRRNSVTLVASMFRRAANSFADKLQSRGEETLEDFVTASGRTIDGTDWTTAHTGGLIDIDPATLPQADFGLVLKQFIEDKAGVRPDRLILSTDDALRLDIIYGDKLPALLSRYGIQLRVSARRPEGKALFVKSGQVGVMAFEKPLDQEYTRIGRRKTDEYILESVPVFVANGAEALLEVVIDGS